MTDEVCLVKTAAAVIRSTPGEFEIETVELNGPRQGELLIKVSAAGVCHSDDHFAKGDIPVDLPMVCGHEGAGVVAEVGPHTTGFEVGDHVALAWIPSCGRCRWCAMGKQNLCDLGAQASAGARPEDPSSFRMTIGSENVGQATGVGAFSEYTVVSVNSAIKVPRHLPLAAVALATCSIGTGWGSAVRVAQVAPGEVVIVMGVGGVGIHAVQGAAMSGAAHVIAVDPVPFKRETALSSGATSAYADIEEAAEFARSVTNGQGADATLVCIGFTTPEHVGQAFASIRKGGAAVITGLGDVSKVGIPIGMGELTLYEKKLLGGLYGSCVPTYDIPLLLSLYESGRLEIDRYITRTYQLDEVNKALADLHSGEVIKGVVTFA